MQPDCLATVNRESNGKLAVSLFYQWHVYPVTMQFELKVTNCNENFLASSSNSSKIAKLKVLGYFF